MATTTTNYGLTKPSYNDSADIAVINSNMDIIDSKMKEIENKAGSGGGGGGGASAWSDISGKPFESIGNGLEVDENGVMSATGGTVDAYTKEQTDNLLNNKADKEIISDEWSASTTYAVGQYCIYNNSLWKCLVQNNGQTPTEGTYWTKVSVSNEISSLNSSLSYGTKNTSLANKTIEAYQILEIDDVIPYESGYNYLPSLVFCSYGCTLTNFWFDGASNKFNALIKNNTPNVITFGSNDFLTFRYIKIKIK